MQCDMGVLKLETKKLTLRQKKFADFFIETGNASKAASMAGYSKKSAAVIANKNFKIAKVRNYINMRLESIESKRIADAAEVMEFLTSVMRREHKDMVLVTHNEETSTYVPDEGGKMRKQTIKRGVHELVSVPVKLSDANKAAELLGKRYVLFNDKANFDDKTPVVICGEDKIEE